MRYPSQPKGQKQKINLSLCYKRHFQAAWDAHLSRWVTHHKVLWGEISVLLSIELSQPGTNAAEEDAKHRNIEHHNPWSGGIVLQEGKYIPTKSLTPSFFSLPCLGEFSVTTIQCHSALSSPDWEGRVPRVSGVDVSTASLKASQMLWDRMCLLGPKEPLKMQKKEVQGRMWI